MEGKLQLLFMEGKFHLLEINLKDNKRSKY